MAKQQTTIQTQNIANNPLVFDTPAYQQLTGQTTPTMTPVQKKETEKTIQGFKDYVAQQPSSPSVASSDYMSNLIANYTKQINKLKTQLTDTSNFYWNQQNQMGEALTEAQKKAQQKKTAQQTTGQGEMEDTGLDSLSSDLGYVQNQLLKSNRDLTDLYAAQIRNMDQFKQTLDEQHQSLVSNIQETYDMRRQQQIQENQARVGGLNVAGIRSGRARFAPEMQEMLMSEQERANLTKLTEIDAEERKAILEADTAFNEDNFDLFTKKVEAIESMQKAKADLVQTLYQNSLDFEKFRLDQRRETRQAEMDQLDMSIKQAELYAPTILNELTGNPDTDESLIQSYSRQLGVDPETLRGVVEGYLYEERQKAIERNFQRSLRDSEKESMFSLEDTVDFGLPTSVEGMSKATVAEQFSSPVPPSWFVQEMKLITKDAKLTASDERVQQRWDAYRESKKETFGSDLMGENAYSPTSFGFEEPKIEETTTEEDGGGFWNWLKSLGNTDTSKSGTIEM